MILIESNFSNIQTLIEGVENEKKLYLQGVFMEAEKPNRNGRKYKLKHMNEAIKYVNDKAKSGQNVLGELDHPFPQTLEIRLENVSHKLVELKLVGNQVIGKAEILTSVPKGQIAKGLIESGVSVGVSSRAGGSVNESGVVDTFEFVTIDMVATPSVDAAKPKSLMEALDMYGRKQVIDNLAEAAIHDPSAQKYFQKEILKFVRNGFNK